MQRRFDAVLFDFDGTVADTGAGIFASANHAAQALGFPPPTEAQLRRFVGPPLLESFQELIGMTPEQAQAAVTAYRSYYEAHAIFRLTLYPGMRETLAALHAAGVRVVIASSKPERFARRITAHLGLDPLIDDFSCPRDDRVHEDKEMLIRRALRQGGVEAARAAMVGDRCYDMIGAGRAGVTAIGAAYGYGGAQELLASGASQLIDTPAALLPLVGVAPQDPGNLTEDL
ncbi:MAG: HAD hydrolase-like protein [Clostridia bacterium]|nr:HAD hydrolase-like protein [Clostridia bacterium]